MRSLMKVRNSTKEWRYDPFLPVAFAYRIAVTLCKWLLNLVYLIPATFFWLRNLRVPPFFTSRIGHLMLEPDCLIKEMRLGLAPERRHILLAPRSKVANQAAISYWKKYYTVYTSPIATLLSRPLSWHPFTRVDVSRYGTAINETAAFPRIQALWGGNPPLLKTSDGDRSEGAKFLESIGVPPGAWYVCVHSRESGYSPADEHLHGYRNSPFHDYLTAIDHIVSQGGICIRMGDPSMADIAEKPGLIDYAHHPGRRDWLDLYLCANCRLFLGNSSGAFIMSAVFGVPVACANMVPLSSIYPWGSKDLGIPKLYKRTSTGQLLPFKEILDLPMGDFRTTIEFDREGIEPVDNSPDEIRDLLVEQLRRTTDADFSYSEEEELLQQRFRALFRSGHYTYGSASRVGTAFLRKYQRLLP